MPDEPTTELREATAAEKIQEAAAELAGNAPTAIENAEDYEEAAQLLLDLASAHKGLEKQRKVDGEPHRLKVNGINAAYKPAGEAIGKAIGSVKRLMLGWDREQARIIREREAKARVDEADRLAKIREQERKDALAKREAEAVQHADETGDETKMAPEAIQHAVDQDVKRAEILRGPEEAPTIVKPVEAVKPKGIGQRMHTTFKVTDKDRIPKKYWTLDEGKIRLEVKVSGLETKIPGVEVFEEPIITTRTT